MTVQLVGSSGVAASGGTCELPTTAHILETTSNACVVRSPNPPTTPFDALPLLQETARVCCGH